MNTCNYHQEYPVSIEILSLILSLSIYLTGFYLIFQMGLIWALLYAIYILILEFRLLKYHCINCYYFGKRCAFGKGKLAALFFKQGQSEKFMHLNITWKTMIPDFLVMLIPLSFGIISMIKEFRWSTLVLVVVLVLLSTMGNGWIRGSFACKHCKQKEIGCPADQLFNKK